MQMLSGRNIFLGKSCHGQLQTPRSEVSYAFHVIPLRNTLAQRLERGGILPLKLTAELGKTSTQTHPTLLRRLLAKRNY